MKSPQLLDRDALLPKLLSDELRAPAVSGEMSTAN